MSEVDGDFVVEAAAAGAGEAATGTVDEDDADDREGGAAFPIALA